MLPCLQICKDSIRSARCLSLKFCPPTSLPLCIPFTRSSVTGEGRAEMGEVAGKIILSMLRIPSLSLLVAAAMLFLNVFENIDENPDFGVNPVRGELVPVLVLRGVEKIPSNSIGN